MERKSLIFFIIVILLLPSLICDSFAKRDNLDLLPQRNSSIEINVEWEQVVDHGFGNINNLHAWSMEEYKGFLYVGTRNVIDGCQIYRSETGDKGTWKKVSIDGLCNESKSEGARHMIVYHDLLWVITISWDHGAQVWVTDGEDFDEDGILNWKKANLDGFGEGKQIIETRAITVYCDKLFVGCGSNDSHPLLFRYDGETEYSSINPVHWTLLKDWYEDPNYDPDLFLVGEMTNFTGSDGRDYLYAILITGVTPLKRWLHENLSFILLVKTLKTMLFAKSQIWRYDGEHWENIGREVFNNTNLMGSTFKVFNGSLYIGTANFLGGEIWSTQDGIHWRQNSKRGFYSPFNFWVWKLFSYNNRLVAGTFNPLLGGEVWISTNDAPRKQNDFIKISKHGIDGSNFFTSGELPQDGARSFETFYGKLYTGTTNWVDLNTDLTGTGCEVWRISTLPAIKGK